MILISAETIRKSLPSKDKRLIEQLMSEEYQISNKILDDYDAVDKIDIIGKIYDHITLIQLIGLNRVLIILSATGKYDKELYTICCKLMSQLKGTWENTQQNDIVYNFLIELLALKSIGYIDDYNSLLGWIALKELERQSEDDSRGEIPLSLGFVINKVSKIIDSTKNIYNFDVVLQDLFRDILYTVVTDNMDDAVYNYTEYSDLIHRHSREFLPDDQARLVIDYINTLPDALL